MPTGEGSLISSLHPVARSILLSRVGGDLAAAERFLAGSPPHSPDLLPGLPEAADHLASLPPSSVIAIHGDYDVDGVCGSAILHLALSSCGLTPVVKLPSRSGDGYGLSARQVAQSLAGGARTLITVDCGISCPDEVALANSGGATTIVTDHHEPRPDGRLPDSAFLVHPLLRQGYPYPQLCGSAIAYKLALATLARRGLRPDPDLLALAALGTVADVMPLTGENRDLVRVGLVRFASSARPGFRAILSSSRLSPPLAADAFGFQIGPRVNACGRLESAALAFELLTTLDPARAGFLAGEADRLNAERRRLERVITEQAIDQHSGKEYYPVCLVCSPDWHAGVIGVVAGRLAERYGVPTFVAHGPDARGMISGSARSGESGVSVHALLSCCSSVLSRWGGHHAAGGFALEHSRLEELRSVLLAAAGSARLEAARRATPRGPRQHPDLGFEQIDLSLADDLARLAPFGRGNPDPRFSSVCRPSEVRPIGDGSHLSLRLTDASGRSLRAVAFRMGERAAELSFSGQVRASFSVRSNEFRGVRSAELTLHGFEVAEVGR